MKRLLRLTVILAMVLTATAFAAVPAAACDEGCTPGYWKNHIESWPATGYAPGDDFDATFGVGLFTPNITLLDALNLGGSRDGINQLARAAVAALLNSASPDVAYPLTWLDIKADIESGYAHTLTKWRLIYHKDIFEKYNSLGCPLN